MDKRVLDGTIKWFDAAKGFGFVVTEALEKDILLHANVLKDYGQSSIAEGTGITVEVVSTDRGQQATRILQVQPPSVDLDLAIAKAGEFFPGVVAEDFDRALEPVRVKWFDKGRGFGCLNRLGDMEDVFIHIEILRAFGLSELETGEAVCAKIAKGTRGLVAIEVRSWDYVARNQDIQQH